MSDTTMIPEAKSNPARQSHTKRSATAGPSTKRSDVQKQSSNPSEAPAKRRAVQKQIRKSKGASETGRRAQKYTEDSKVPSASRGPKNVQISYFIVSASKKILSCIRKYCSRFFCAVRRDKIKISTFLAGEEGFEPSHVGFKGRCLTTWRLPNGVFH